MQLYERLQVLFDEDSLDKEIPSYIAGNLSSRIALRPYQNKAISFFRHRLKSQSRPKPDQLLFHMATGSGKTVIMASLILELYHKGYRNFLFFVNSSNILNKTRDNFLNQLSSKYLFADNLLFNDSRVYVREVSNFERVDDKAINIHFTTIQGLHGNLEKPSENSITLGDFEDKKIVLISDEAHHLNALTKKKLTKSETDEENSWEYTVSSILSKNHDNLLLEFSATVNLKEPAINEKYREKIIYNYTLKEFRQDRYSKDVNLIQDDFSEENRMLQAIIISQFRRKVAESNGIALKPVVMMKSKDIKDSEENEDRFYKLIENLTEAKIIEVMNGKGLSKIAGEAFEYFRSKGVAPANLVRELKGDFDKPKCISVNSSKNAEEYQIKINTLEAQDNAIRVVFDVKILNEGWDVLNLYDIVRLYSTRSDTQTTQEAQLIGRGARYFPFKISDSQEADKRKYDDDLENPLRVLEELHYHSYNDSKYISEIRQALVESGILPNQRKEIEVNVKDSFKQTWFWKAGFVYHNELQKNKREGISGFDSLKIGKEFSYSLSSNQSEERTVFGKEQVESNNQKKITKTYKFSQLITKEAARFAMDKNPFFHFRSLRKHFPSIQSVSSFITSQDFLGSLLIHLDATASQHEKIRPKEELEIALYILKVLEAEISKQSLDYTGSKRFKRSAVSKVVVDKRLTFALEAGSSDREFGISINQSPNQAFNHIRLKDRHWYVYDDFYGTSEEKYFIKYINDREDELKKKYEEFYLLRNDSLLALFDFTEGKRFEPDFLLFLKEKGKPKPVIYQLFIEPKGEGFKDKDKWKEDFLLQIQNESLLEEDMLKEAEYRLVGLPFFEDANKAGFIEYFKKITGLQ